MTTGRRCGRLPDCCPRSRTDSKKKDNGAGLASFEDIVTGCRVPAARFRYVLAVLPRILWHRASALCNRRYDHRVDRARKLFALAFVCAALASACTRDDEPRPIVVDAGTVIVSNLTKDEWRQVEIWLNYYYRVTKASMAPGERFSIPLNSFVAGYGQRFDVKRQVVQTIQVTAKTLSGAPVELMFGTGPRR